MDIFRAARGGDLERVRALVEQNAETVHAHHAVDGRTALVWAAQGGHSGVVRYLHDAGADIDYRDQHGTTALHWACLRGHAGVVSLLLQRGADVTATDLYGFTALMFAAHGGRYNIVRLLFEHGGSHLDAADDNGRTALYHACDGGRAVTVQQLLEAGADPTLRDVKGRTAVDRAARGAAHGRQSYQSCVRIIQEWERAYMLRKVRSLRDASSGSSEPPSS